MVPTSVMLNWEMELKKWCPGLKILTYYGTPKERKQKRVVCVVFLPFAAPEWFSQRWQSLNHIRIDMAKLSSSKIKFRYIMRG